MASKTEVRPEERPYKKQRMYSSLDESVRILAGKDKSPVIVHKKLICEASTFVRKACEDQGKHPSDKSIELPEDDALLVRTMVYWVYHNIIRIPEFSPSSIFATTSDSPNGGCFLLIRLFVLADKLQMPRLKNDAIDAMIQIWSNSEDFLTPESVNYVYSNTQPESVLRKLVVTLVRYDFSSHDFETVDKDASGGFCSDFKGDLVVRLIQAEDNVEHTRQEAPTSDFCAEYHSHGEGSGLECEKLKDFETIDAI